MLVAGRLGCAKMSLLPVTSSPALNAFWTATGASTGNISYISVAPNNTYIYNGTDTCVATSACGTNSSTQVSPNFGGNVWATIQQALSGDCNNVHPACPHTQQLSCTDRLGCAANNTRLFVAGPYPVGIPEECVAYCSSLSKPIAYVDQGSCFCGSGSEVTLGGTCDAQCPGDTWRTCGSTDETAGSVFRVAADYSPAVASLYEYAFQGYYFLQEAAEGGSPVWNASASTVPQCITLCASDYQYQYATFDNSDHSCYCKSDMPVTLTTTPSNIWLYSIDAFITFAATAYGVSPTIQAILNAEISASCGQDIGWRRLVTALGPTTSLYQCELTCKEAGYQIAGVRNFDSQEYCECGLNQPSTFTYFTPSSDGCYTDPDIEYYLPLGNSTLKTIAYIPINDPLPSPPLYVTASSGCTSNAMIAAAYCHGINGLTGCGTSYSSVEEALAVATAYNTDIAWSPALNVSIPIDLGLKLVTDGDFTYFFQRHLKLYIPDIPFR